MSLQEQEPVQQHNLRPRFRSQDLTSLQRIIVLQHKLNGAYTFKDDLLALESLQDTNLPQEVHGRFRDIPNNKELAILGDILLNLHLCLEWLLTEDTRETFENTKQRIVCNDNLARIGREAGLDECIIRTPGTVQSVGRIGMASAVEAIVGAVFKDAEKNKRGTGYEAAFRVATEFGIRYNN